MSDTTTKEEPLVSIVTGFYNRAELLDYSLESLINQTYTNLEIIVFDDCSTDDTLSVLTRHTDPRLKVISFKSNIGFTNGLIKAIESTKGKYIAIHGSGDYSYPTRIEKQVKVLEEKNSVGVVGCLLEFYTMDKQFIRNFGQDQQVNDGKEVLASRNIFKHGEVMIRKEAYDHIGGYNGFFSYCQDRDLWSRMSDQWKFFTIQEVLYRNYRPAESVTANKLKAAQQAVYSEISRRDHLARLNNGIILSKKFSILSILAIEKSNRVSSMAFNAAKHYLGDGELSKIEKSFFKKLALFSLYLNPSYRKLLSVIKLLFK